MVEFRERLQQLWNDAHSNPGQAVAQLKDWCREAEASGIRALCEFAQRLRSYESVSI